MLQNERIFHSQHLKMQPYIRTQYLFKKLLVLTQYPEQRHATARGVLHRFAEVLANVHLDGVVLRVRVALRSGCITDPGIKMHTGMLISLDFLFARIIYQLCQF